MGYGGSTFSGTLNVDLVQTDVQAIVDGITGGDSLADISSHLQNISGYLYDPNSNTSLYSLVESMRQSVDSLSNCLYQVYPGRTAIDVLASLESLLIEIRYNTGQ